MAKKNSDYWDKRLADERKWIDSNVTNDTEFNKKIASRYDTMLNNIDTQIQAEFNRYASYSGTSSQAAAQKISVTDIKEFEKEATEVVKQAAEMQGKVSYADFSNEVNDRMKLYNATMRVNRLELLKAKIGTEAVKANLDISKDIALNLGKGYQKEVKRQAGILGEHVGNISTSKTVKAVMGQTAGATFSERLWANQDVMKAKLDQLVSQAIIRGQNPRVIARELRPLLNDTVKNQKYVSERIARTEMARVQDKAQIDSFKKYGYEYCKWVPEPTACKYCRSIAEQQDGVYKVDDAPSIPVHANCRCSKSAWYKEDKKSSDKSKEVNSVSEPKINVWNASPDIKKMISSINLKTATADDLISLGKAINDKHDVMGKVGNKASLVNIFSEYREMGGSVSKSTWYPRSNKIVKDQLQDAFSYYPKDWANYIENNNQKIYAGKKQRGFFSSEIVDGNGYYKRGVSKGDGVSIYANGKRATTPFHEIGHLVDSYNPDLVRIEKEFVANRTEGEDFTKLRDIFPGSGYNVKEVTKKDNFISPYIGKDYKEATEVLSVGLESIFEPGNGKIQGIKNGKYVKKTIADDPEYLNLLIGLILKG